MSISSLSAEQKEVVYAVEDGENIFVTGSAGTGKSYLLQYLRKNYSNHGLHITASTGVAAVNIGGQTLHSWSGIGLGNLPIEQLIKNLFSAKFSRVRRKIKLAKMLAIDEVSMISPKIFDLINELLKAVRQSDKPFGGLQLILFGDFLQLPPVYRNEIVSNDYQFCFHSQAWQELNPKTFILKTAFRQQDQSFVKLLNNIRVGQVDDEDIEVLKSRFNVTDTQNHIKPTILVSHNSQVDNINQFELNKIPRESHIFKGSFFGDKNKFDFLRKNCIASEKLELKVGAQVMMLKNTYQKDSIINGSLGVIRDFSTKRGYPIVEFQNGKVITIAPEEWLLEKFDQEKNKTIVEAGFEQIPLILSWAITIHKSQGMTLDKIQCDLGRVFSEGQIYVALSRVKTLNGLYITDLNLSKIRANQQVTNFYKELS
ncbi:MAG: PIF1 family ATP-dependent DNA helicase [Proteobacteria bacterium]|nr:PIF1 family ATP-dependent DNA helicase [Pseudomonadota bacterium]